MVAQVGALPSPVSVTSLQISLQKECGVHLATFMRHECKLRYRSDCNVVASAQSRNFEERTIGTTENQLSSSPPALLYVQVRRPRRPQERQRQPDRHGPLTLPILNIHRQGELKVDTPGPRADGRACVQAREDHVNGHLDALRHGPWVG